MSKYCEEKVKQIEKAINTGVSVNRTCDLVGLSPDTFYTWMKEKAGFADRVKRARGEKISTLLKNIKAAGIGETTFECKKCGHKNKVQLSTKSWQSLAWILERTESKDFVVKIKSEVTGEGGGPIEFIEVGERKEVKVEKNQQVKESE